MLAAIVLGMALSLAVADRNHDGVVERAEAERRALDVFYFADTDKNGRLTRDEFAALVVGDDFAVEDADHDGALSLKEFVAARLREFDAADTDHDGRVSLDEPGSTREGRK
jgi:Ca2+-binding EF-hand superfamily protein